jgi:hypothetical protein
MRALSSCHRRCCGWFIVFYLLTLHAVVGDPQASPPGWRLLRTPNPAGGQDAVSITRAADISSDVDLAGLMLRCHEGGTEVALIVITPFSPRARPDVTISAIGQEWRFVATVAPPGAELRLPVAASALAAGPWQSANQIAVKISWESTSIRGAIPIDGLANALVTLTANCLPH